MADSVNRIVPPSVSLDRSTGLGRERERKKKEETPKRSPEPTSAPLAEEPAAKEPGDVIEPEKDKGGNLDISA